MLAAANAANNAIAEFTRDDVQAVWIYFAAGIAFIIALIAFVTWYRHRVREAGHVS